MLTELSSVANIYCIFENPLFSTCLPCLPRMNLGQQVPRGQMLLTSYECNNEYPSSVIKCVNFSVILFIVLLRTDKKYVTDNYDSNYNTYQFYFNLYTYYFRDQKKKISDFRIAQIFLIILWFRPDIAAGQYLPLLWMI